VFSDAGKDEPIISELIKTKRLPEGVEILIGTLPDINPNEINIFKIKNIDAAIFKNILRVETEISKEFIFLFDPENILALSATAKMGFPRIFIVPDELPILISNLNSLVNNKQHEGISGNNNNTEVSNFDSLIGNSAGLLKIKELAKRVTETSSSNILILGETGTGKGVLAKSLHINSPVKDSPFVDIICSAIPENLIESELFGYEPGAFTNAQNLKVGLFELAGSGTLFLDEIGDLGLGIQAKLLRAIEKKVIRRLGGVVDIPIGARIIAATNKNLEIMIEQNTFREDLYHRLNVISFLIPPLRERREDILLLADHFIKIFNRQFNKSVKGIEKDAEEFLLNYKWPGNVRELRNAFERAILLSDGSKLKLVHFTTIIDSIPINESDFKDLSSYHPRLVNLICNYETTDLLKLTKIYAKEILERMNGNKFKTAKVLKVSRPKLDQLLK
jgi:two-component system response regulator AtoC